MKLTLKAVLPLSGMLLWVGGLAAADLSRDYTTNLCPTGLNIPPRPTVDAVLEVDDTYITADEADLVEYGLSTLDGDAEITRNTQQVRADHIEYDEPADTADLDGNVNYWDEDVYLKSEDAYLTFDNGVGDFSNADYILVDSRGRGKTERLVLDVGTRTEMERLRYTTCDPDDEFWHFTASKLVLDHEKNRGTARNFVLKIKDVPVFYSPYLSFPLSKERKSGFLAPGFGTTNDYGFELRTPYYWNIAPNMDATLTPRLLTDTGVMAMGEFRYLTETGRGEIKAEYLPSDNKFNDEHRNAVGINLEQRFLDRGMALINYNRVSDRFYLEDFGTQLSVTSASFVQQTGDFRYNWSRWRSRLLVQNFQITNPDIVTTPYKRLPQFYLDYNSAPRNNSFNYGLNSQFAYFYRDVGVSADDVNGMRIDIKPYVSYPMRTLSSFIEPKLGVRYTQYSLDENTQFDSNPNRILPYFTLDSGLFFERQTSILGNKMTQTLEPRLFYLYIPREDQDDLPVFDTGLYTFTFDTLFREDRFSGPDRMGDANQMTLSVTSQFVDDQTGRSYGGISFGQILYFKDREVTLPDYQQRGEFASSFVLGFESNFIQNTEISGDFQWNPHVSDGTERLTLRASYNPEPGKIVNASYRVVRSNEINTVRSRNFLGQFDTDIEQTDISFRWPLTQNWSMVGRWNYSIPEDRSLETFAGVEYSSCCWGVRAVARRFLSSTDGDFETGVFLQLELKGLAGIGRDTVNFLQQQIPGYKSDF